MVKVDALSSPDVQNSQRSVSHPNETQRTGSKLQDGTDPDEEAMEKKWFPFKLDHSAPEDEGYVIN